MSNAWKIIRLNFTAMLNVQIVILAAVFLLHVLISFAILRLVNTEGPAGVGDGIGLITLPILTLIFFMPGFKYALSQGISRKTFFEAVTLNTFLMAVIIAVMATVFYLINLKIANVWMIYKLIYPGPVSLIGLMVWELAALFLLGTLGWFIRLLYFRMNRVTKYVVSIAPFVLAALLTLFNSLTSGAIGRAIWGFLKAIMGLQDIGENPYVGTASMLVAASVLIGLNYLLLRRAQINQL